MSTSSVLRGWDCNFTFFGNIVSKHMCSIFNVSLHFPCCILLRKIFNGFHNFLPCLTIFNFSASFFMKIPKNCIVTEQFNPTASIIELVLYTDTEKLLMKIRWYTLLIHSRGFSFVDKRCWKKNASSAFILVQIYIVTFLLMMTPIIHIVDWSIVNLCSQVAKEFLSWFVGGKSASTGNWYPNYWDRRLLGYHSWDTLIPPE